MKNPLSLAGRLMLVLAWLSLTMLLTLVYNTWINSQYNPNRQPESHQYLSGVKEVTLTRNRFGHYVSSGWINQEEVIFLLDTGSTQVAVPGHIAEIIGLEYGEKQATGTANGTIWVYNTTIDHLRLGNIELNNVKASINPYMEEPEVLLGMSVLNHLDFQQRGGKLKLQQYR